jgi:hypothetical protein
MESRSPRPGERGRYAAIAMSIDYFATLSGNRDKCLAIMRGEDTSLPLENRNLIRGILIADIVGLQSDGPPELYQLMWSLDGYIQVHVNEYSVDITHGTGGGDQLLPTLEAIIDILVNNGLRVFNPQSDDFLPGHAEHVPAAPVPRSAPSARTKCLSCRDSIRAWRCIHCESLISDSCQECHNELKH